MRGQFLLIGWVSLLAAAAGGCTTARPEGSPFVAEDAAARPAMAPAPAEFAIQGQGELARLAAFEATGTQSATERILVYTAQLGLAVSDFVRTLEQVRRLAEESGGYMQSLSGDAITVRVPAAKFDAVLESIGRLGQITSRQINAQDITDEYVDLRLRLKNAQATRDRLLEILKTASKVEEVLAVEKELARVREEIERIEGRLNVLQQQVAYSAITVSLTPAAGQTAERLRPAPPFPWVDRLGVEAVLHMQRPRLELR